MTRHARRASRTSRDVRRQVPILIVAGVILVAVIFVAADRWRRGAFVFGSATLLAAGIRFLLPEEQVGVLAVRSRTFDSVALFTLGTAIVWLAFSVESLGTG